MTSIVRASIPPKPSLKIILTPSCTLVPYIPSHVPTYNNWMQSPELLETTGSEPLSLDEEYAMCDSWRDDSDKITYIILSPDDQTDDLISLSPSPKPYTEPLTVPLTINYITSRLPKMLGDCNLFLSLNEELGDTGELTVSTFEAELEIMLAEQDSRKKGIATLACKILINEAFNLGVHRVFVKIKDGNVGSKMLFEKLGFKLVKYVECFKETEMEVLESQVITEDIEEVEYVEEET
ncbi:hypothetical protein TrLO_g8942 [Triparma laevis f. longispina]|uniref:N-acetyltransferase domain-containing protein n=1 Tax=Triparma laevis f. longispina TaxID=1714387 RepID=A0A9W7L1B4_9STRA|nr:hypothetical protein TrLO_g8942 [Triparma laevis f. longispina]